MKRLPSLKKMIGGPRRKPHRGPQGAPPGTLSVDPSSPKPEIDVIAFNEEECVERQIENVSELREIGDDYVRWINVDGLGDVDTISAIGDVYGLHPLSLEDVVHVHQRAKVEEFDQYVFIVLRMITVEGHDLLSEQLSIFLGRNFVLTFQEKAGDCLEPVRDRLRKGKGRIRKHPPDYLAYAIVDAVVDAYFPLLEGFGDRLEALEDRILSQEADDVVGTIHEIRRTLLTLRRSAWPLRDAIGALLREGRTELISEDTQVFLRDCQDHGMQIVDLVETYRELASGLMDTHLSLVNNRMNEVMKVLTIIATIFIPLTFVAGIYGMNFDPKASPYNMPELAWEYGYPTVLVCMTVVAGALVLFFRRKGWM